MKKTIRRTLPVTTAAILLAAGGFVGSASGQVGTSTDVAPASSKSVATMSQSGISGTQADSPAELLRLLGERIKDKDLDGIIALHAPRAAIVNYDGSIVRGRKEIREFYADWFKSDPVLTVDPQQVVEGGGWQWNGKVYGRVATVMGGYTLEQTGSDGTRVKFSGDFCDVVRELPDGTWMYVFDNPYPPHH